MGSEDLFKNRKARHKSAIERERNLRRTNKRFLIVCEGTKTEPHYFFEMLSHLKIPQHLIRIAKNNGSSPDKVVSHALELYNEDASLGDPFDEVYCVFDRDKHPTFEAAVDRAHALRTSGKPFNPITSNPCFEVWFILHFGYCDTPFQSKGKKSIAQDAIDELKKKAGFKKYEKGTKGFFMILMNKKDDAIKNARRLRQKNDLTANKNPATDVDKLVDAIYSFKR